MKTLITTGRDCGSAKWINIFCASQDYEDDDTELQYRVKFISLIFILFKLVSV